jgi:hypothetical protein
VIAALIALSLVIPARDAWTTGYVVDTPRAWGVGGGLSMKWRDGPACAPLPEGAYKRQSVAVAGGVVCGTEHGKAAPFTIQRAGAWSRAVASSVLFVVALPRDRVAVLLDRQLLVVDAHTGADAAPPLTLPGYPSWADVDGDGDVLLVRVHNEIAAIDVSGARLDVLWRDQSVGDPVDGPLVHCGRRWIELAAVREFHGDVARTRAHVVLRAFDAKQGLLGRMHVKTEEHFFDTVRFEPNCSDEGRIHAVARWIILD